MVEDLHDVPADAASHDEEVSALQAVLFVLKALALAALALAIGASVSQVVVSKFQPEPRVVAQGR